jgi:hypothetical protein
MPAREAALWPGSERSASRSVRVHPRRKRADGRTGGPDGAPPSLARQENSAGRERFLRSAAFTCGTLAVVVHSKSNARQGSRSLAGFGTIRVAQRPRSSAAKKGGQADRRNRRCATGSSPTMALSLSVTVPAFTCGTLAVVVQSKSNARQGSRSLAGFGTIRVAQRPRSSAAKKGGQADRRTGGQADPMVRHGFCPGKRAQPVSCSSQQS